MGESEADEERRPGSPFDPAAGIRALGAIQAEGLRAAGELIERMLRAEPDPPGRPAPSAAAGYAALVDAWTDLLRHTVDGLTRPAGRDGVTVAVEAAGVAPPVRLRLSASGAGEAAAEVWLHNGGASAVGPLALRCGPLSDAAGVVLEGADVRLEPADVAVLPGRSSRGVAVSVHATGALRAGVYRGAIQARGAPALWVPLEVAVAPC